MKQDETTKDFPVLLNSCLSHFHGEANLQLPHLRKHVHFPSFIHRIRLLTISAAVKNF